MSLFPRRNTAYEEGLSSAEVISAMSIRSRPRPEGKTNLAVRYTYDMDSKEWKKEEIFVLLATEPFARGYRKLCYDLYVQQADGVDLQRSGVAKILKPHFVSKQREAESYFDEALTQTVAYSYAGMFNRQLLSSNITNDGKHPFVKFLPVSLLQIVTHGSASTLCLAEPLLDEDYVKHNDNGGRASSNAATLQAFSHFTWDTSEYQLVVCDMQGVNDFYTEPQIHSDDGQGFGIDNLGSAGIARFLKRHKCNSLCHRLGLAEPKLVDGVWTANPSPGGDQARVRMVSDNHLDGFKKDNGDLEEIDAHPSETESPIQSGSPMYDRRRDHSGNESLPGQSKALLSADVPNESDSLVQRMALKEVEDSRRCTHLDTGVPEKKMQSFAGMKQSCELMEQSEIDQMSLHHFMARVLERVTGKVRSEVVSPRVRSEVVSPRVRSEVVSPRVRSEVVSPFVYSESSDHENDHAAPDEDTLQCWREEEKQLASGRFSSWNTQSFVSILGMCPSEKRSLSPAPSCEDLPSTAKKDSRLQSPMSFERGRGMIQSISGSFRKVCGSTSPARSSKRNSLTPSRVMDKIKGVVMRRSSNTPDSPPSSEYSGENTEMVGRRSPVSAERLSSTMNWTLPPDHVTEKRQHTIDMRENEDVKQFHSSLIFPGQSEQISTPGDALSVFSCEECCHGDASSHEDFDEGTPMTNLHQLDGSAPLLPDSSIPSIDTVVVEASMHPGMPGGLTIRQNMAILREEVGALRLELAQRLDVRSGCLQGLGFGISCRHQLLSRGARD